MKKTYGLSATVKRQIAVFMDDNADVYFEEVYIFELYIINFFTQKSVDRESKRRKSVNGFITFATSEKHPIE